MPVDGWLHITDIIERADTRSPVTVRLMTIVRRPHLRHASGVYMISMNCHCWNMSSGGPR